MALARSALTVSMVSVSLSMLLFSVFLLNPVTMTVVRFSPGEPIMAADTLISASMVPPMIWLLGESRMTSFALMVLLIQ